MPIKKVEKIANLPEDKINTGVSNQGEMHISIENISLNNELGQTTLSNFSINIAPDDIIYMVGSNMVNELFRAILEPEFQNEGTIAINQIPLQNINQLELREKIGFVDQRERVFSGTLIDNLTLGTSDFNNDLFKELAEEFSASAIEQTIQFRLVETSAWVYSDRNLLRRILQNLIGNAFRYASPGKVLLGARINNQTVIIQVLDNGPGIPIEKQSLVFEQFTQLDTPQSQSGRGLGLGLNITQSLTQLLGHSLGLKSKESQGCKFTISLKKVSPVLQPMIEKPSVKIGFSDITVMCIDNDPDVLSGMVELLSAWQCNVLAADSFEQAQSIFTQHSNDIQILLVDYQLDNDHNGLNLISLLREKCPHHIPAILITATTDSDIEEKTKAANVGYMRKLVKPASLRAMMSALLAKNLQDKYS